MLARSLNKWYFLFMLKIRLQRVGRKHDPSFRVVLVEAHRAPQTGKVMEILGNYDARRKRIVLQRERIDHWLSRGAQSSDTVRDLLRKSTQK